MYQHRPYPEKSWSTSKLSIFKKCRRQYYYATFGHWNGWERTADARTKQIYRLKKLQNKYTLSGQLLHEWIKGVLKGDARSMEETLQTIRTSLNTAVYQSRHNREQWQQYPNKYTMMMEYYYGKGITKTAGAALMERIRVCMENFYRSKTYNAIQKYPVKIIELDKEDFPHFMFEGVKIYSILDLLYQIGDKYVVVDWKTGREGELVHRQQLAIYAWYVIHQYPNVALENVICVNEYLQAGKYLETRFTAEDMAAAEQLLRDSISSMDDYLVDSVTNQPKEEKVFPVNVNKQCLYCPYLEVCTEGQAYSKNISKQ